MRYLSIVVAVAALAGCASGTTVFHSTDAKFNVVCHGAGLWWLPGTTASSEYQACQAAQEKSGYLEGPAPVRPIPSGVSSQGPS